MVEIDDLSKLPRSAAVEKAIELFRFVRSDAEFYVAISRGEIDGDVIDVSDEDAV